MIEVAVPRSGGEMHEADRLLRRAAARPGNAGDGNHDTGIGVASHDWPHIWDRLYRGDQSRAERGLGLGLSLVRAIVVAHGGTVEVEAEPGRGSTFIVKLPVRSA